MNTGRCFFKHLRIAALASLGLTVRLTDISLDMMLTFNKKLLKEIVYSVTIVAKISGCVKIDSAFL